MEFSFLMIKIDWQREAQTNIPDSGIQNNVTAQKDFVNEIKPTKHKNLTKQAWTIMIAAKTILPQSTCRGSKSYFKRKRRMMRWTMNKKISWWWPQKSSSKTTHCPKCKKHTFENEDDKKSSSPKVLLKKYLVDLVQCILMMRIQLKIIQIHCPKGAQYEPHIHIHASWPVLLEFHSNLLVKPFI